MFVHHKADRHLVILAVVVGLGLTGLTVWAVDRQSRALRAREWGDLRSAAVEAAAEYTTQLRGDLEHAFGTAALAWQIGGVDGLDWWVNDQRRWLFAATCTTDGEPMPFPITPMQIPLPVAGPEAPGLNLDPDCSLEEAAKVLVELEPFLQSDEPLSRAQALLAMADCYRKLDDLSAAAHHYDLTAQTLRSAGALARHAFEPESESIACLLALGQIEPARDRLDALLDEMAAALPTRYSPAEIDFLRKRVEPLLSEAGGTRLQDRFEQLKSRAEIRSVLPDVLAVLAQACQPTTEIDEPDVYFHTIYSDSGGPLVVAIRHVSPTAWLALATRASALVREYWDASADHAWRVVLPPETIDDPLCQLGVPFGGAQLIPSAETREWLAAHSLRGTALVVATAVGTLGAWGVVIWMMLRAMAHQRELVRLQRRFVADISHELKTPLAMIRLLAETLQDGRVHDAQRVQAYYGTITREAERLSVLLDSILDFSRIESGHKQYEFGDCDIASVARQAWALFEPQFAGADFERKLEIAPDLPNIQADPAAVQQILVNLLQNAFRYTDEEKYIRLAVAHEGYLIVITVEDHGIGMTRAQLERLGDTFFRAEDTRVRQTRGSGLGLAIVNHIVQAHGGKLEVHSRPNKGSTFTVWIPFEPPPK